MNQFKVCISRMCPSTKFVQLECEYCRTALCAGHTSLESAANSGALFQSKRGDMFQAVSDSWGKIKSTMKNLENAHKKARKCKKNNNNNLKSKCVRDELQKRRKPHKYAKHRCAVQLVNNVQLEHEYVYKVCTIRMWVSIKYVQLEWEYMYKVCTTRKTALKRDAYPRQ